MYRGGGMRNPIKGRGASDNPLNRFEHVHLDYDLDEETGEKPAPKRELLRDHTLNIISTNNSPDIGFSKSLNHYRGCEHGCAYCYARPDRKRGGWGTEDNCRCRHS